MTNKKTRTRNRNKNNNKKKCTHAAVGKGPRVRGAGSVPGCGVRPPQRASLK